MEQHDKQKEAPEAPDWRRAADAARAAEERRAAQGNPERVFLNKMYDYHRKGIAVARAVAEKEGLVVSDDTIFERGGAIGTSMMIEASKATGWKRR